MVARDDLPDKGARHIAKIIQAVRSLNDGVTIEVLTSDFSGDFDSLDLVLSEKPEIFNHNIETVRSLSQRVRHKADYERTLSVLKHAKDSFRTLFVKSGIMVGLGETELEVQQTILDLYNAGCGIITIGQYLQPSKNKLIVKHFVPPEQFKRYEEYGLSIGVPHMYCGPFVRSSYNADIFVQSALLNKSE
jgi:lipoyl synthase